MPLPGNDIDEPKVQDFHLKDFQDNFIYSQAEHPAMVSAWGTGKSMGLIFRGMIYSEEIPSNLGVVLRKQRKDLEDSTILDYEKYTGRTVHKERMDDVLPNKSRILFRHIEELMGSKKRKGENIQNMNLGWFAFEQGEELPTDNEFFFLFGRLRRKVEPSDYFKRLGLAYRSGFLVANVYGDNWIKKLWKTTPQDQFITLADGAKKYMKDIFELHEANTFDNADNLPEDYFTKMKILKVRKPEIYNRYVMNDWEADIEAKVFKGIDKCIAGTLMKPVPSYYYVGGSDLAKKQDWFTVFVMCRETNHLVYFNRFRRERWSLVKQQINAVSRIYYHAMMNIDSTGVGDPILEDLQDGGTSVDGVIFTNRSKEQLIDKLIIAIEMRLITFPNIQILIDELRAFESIALPSGKIRYQAPPGLTDDCVIGLALAVDQIDVYQSRRELPEPVPFWGKVKEDLVYEKNRKADLKGTELTEGMYKEVTDDGYQGVW